MNRLQSPETTNSSRDPGVARTAKTAQQPLVEPPVELEEGSKQIEAATRQADLNVPVPSPPVIPPPLGEYPIDLSTALRLAEAENPTIAAAGHGSSRLWHYKLQHGHFSCPRSIPARIITFIREISSDPPARSSTSPTNHFTSAAVQGPLLPARSISR